MTGTRGLPAPLTEPKLGRLDIIARLKISLKNSVSLSTKQEEVKAEVWRASSSELGGAQVKELKAILWLAAWGGGVRVPGGSSGMSLPPGLGNMNPSRFSCSPSVR